VALARACDLFIQGIAAASAGANAATGDSAMAGNIALMTVFGIVSCTLSVALVPTASATRA
jgi:hypothetical protein